MTAFFYQGATGVAIVFVPLFDLVQKRWPILAKGDRFNRTQRATRQRLVNRLAIMGLKAILQPDLNKAGVTIIERNNLRRVDKVSRHGFL